MAFPQVQNQATYATNSSLTSHSVTLPSGIVAGELLLVLFAIQYGSDSTISWPSGWTPLSRVSQFSGVGGRSQQWAYRVADGSEGSSISITLSIGSTAAAVSYRVTGHGDVGVQPPEASPGASSGSTTNPPNPDELTPTGGSKDYLWFASAGGADGIVGGPENYTDFVFAGGGAEGRAQSARRELNAASENPGPFEKTGTTSYVWVAQTLAVHPAEATGVTLTLPSVL